MTLKLNPFNTKNPLGLKDAAVISVLSATATYCLSFLVNVSVGQVLLDPAAFAFDSAKTWLQTFWGCLVTLGGLSEYVKRKEPE